LDITNVQSFKRRLRFISLLLASNKCVGLEAVLQDILLGVVFVEEFRLLLLKELILLVIFAFSRLAIFVREMYWRIDFHGCKLLPVEALEEFVLLYLINSNSLVRTLVQKLVQEVFCLTTDILRHLESSRPDTVVELLDVLSVIRWEANKELVENSADLVDVS